jgi:hypothetical protein
MFAMLLPPGKVSVRDCRIEATRHRGPGSEGLSTPSLIFFRVFAGECRNLAMFLRDTTLMTTLPDFNARGETE